MTNDSRFSEESPQSSNSLKVPSISDRPIPEGVYEWGWVSYSDYSAADKPQTVSVFMLDEPASIDHAARIHRAFTRPYWRSLAISYGPLVLALLLISNSIASQIPWIGQICLLLIGISAWNVWRYSQALTEIADRTLEIRVTSDLESYIACKSFLKSLASPRLQAGDLFAYFDLRASAKELNNAISGDTF